jgi:hypothetical protein
MQGGGDDVKEADNCSDVACSISRHAVALHRRSAVHICEIWKSSRTCLATQWLAEDTPCSSSSEKMSSKPIQLSSHALTPLQKVS